MGNELARRTTAGALAALLALGAAACETDSDVTDPGQEEIDDTMTGEEHGPAEQGD